LRKLPSQWSADMRISVSDSSSIEMPSFDFE